MNYKQQLELINKRKAAKALIQSTLEQSDFDEDTTAKVMAILERDTIKVEPVWESDKVSSKLVKHFESAEDIDNFKFCRKHIDTSLDYVTVKVFHSRYDAPTIYLIERKDKVSHASIRKDFVKHGIDYFNAKGYVTYKLEPSDWRFVGKHTNKPRLAIRTSHLSGRDGLDTVLMVTGLTGDAKKRAVKRGYGYIDILVDSKNAWLKRTCTPNKLVDIEEQQAWDKEVEDWLNDETGGVDKQGSISDIPYFSGRSGKMKK